ncbi:MAG: hypothetical protein ACR2PL_01570 [Dehalococcoidia bacterium]
MTMGAWRSSLRQDPAVWLALALTLIFSAIFIVRTAFQIRGVMFFSLFDDAMISMRYARNLAGGHGLLWNPGLPPVEGYTDLLWVLWMAGIHLLRIPDAEASLAVMLSGMLILLAVLLLSRALAMRLAPMNRRVVSMAVWFTAVYYPLLYWTLRGFEVGLVSLAILLGCLLALRLAQRFATRDLLLLSLTLSASVLIRTDVAISGVTVLAFLALVPGVKRRGVVLLCLAAAVFGTLGLHTVFRLEYYGSALPNTYYLKISGSGIGERLTAGSVALFYLLLNHPPVPIVISSVYLVMKRWMVPHGVYLLLALFLGQCLYSLSIGGDAWEWMQYANRFVAPVVPAVLIVSAIGIDALLREKGSPVSTAAGVIAACLGLMLLLDIRDAIRLRLANDSNTIIEPAFIVWKALLIAAWLWLSQGGARQRRGGRLPQPLLTWGSRLALPCLIVLSINGQALLGWVKDGPYLAAEDARQARYGVALRDATRSDASIADSWAGAVPYYSHRTSVDLLGKSDLVIAREPSRGAPFVPGHSKWDYAYSIGRLRPDLVAELPNPLFSQADVAAIEGWGYRVLPGTSVYVRADSERVDPAGVQRAVCVFPSNDRLFLDWLTRPTDFMLLQAQRCGR